MNSVIQFSGGRTSGYMLRRLLDQHSGTLPVDWKICFENTGKEREETLEFVRDVEVNWGVDVTWLEFDDEFNEAEYIESDGTYRKTRRPRNTKYKIVDFHTASRKGEPFVKALEMLANYRRTIKNAPPVLPNVVHRLCTANLKIKICTAFLRTCGWKEWDIYMGIRLDEAQRRAKMMAWLPRYQELQTPLITAKVNKESVSKFWQKSPFDLQLDAQSDEGNCDLCFLKATGKLITIIRKYPGMVNWWKDMETKTGTNFGNTKLSFHQLDQMVKENNPLLDKYIKTPIDKTLDCFCGD
jgi:3'-phosphoadenosine 5'-phosphosulfate sulfotransferase (PAPS reductase)/FAD synthetase